MAGEAAVRALLLAAVPVTNLVGSRVYPVSDIPVDSPLRLVGYTLVSATRAVGSGVDPGLVDSRIQLDCVSGTYGGARALAAAVTAALSRKSGTYGGETVLDTRIETEVDQYSFEADRRWVTVDVLVSTKQ